MTITALNHKYRTSDTSVVYPTTEWGKEYYVFTPPNLNNKEFSLTNGDYTNKVTVFLKGNLKFRGTRYKRGSKLPLILKPYESVIFESKSDLTDTKITSEQPVAVFTGHTCTRVLTLFCNHVYEQLLPVDKWGSTFFVPAMEKQSKYDVVYVTASERTSIKTDPASDPITLPSGTTKDFKITQKNPLYLQADHGIQVLMMFGGAKVRTKVYDAFLLSVLSTDRYCSHYSLRALGNFDSVAVVVAPKTALPKLRLDNKPLPQNTKWKDFPGGENVWTQIDSAQGNILSSSSAPFALYSVGFAERNGYGSAGQCVQPGKTHA